jgi:hypothetical protein
MSQRCILPPSSGYPDDGVCTAETLVYFNETTRRYVPEDCHLHTRSQTKISQGDILTRLADASLTEDIVSSMEN